MPQIAQCIILLKEMFIECQLGNIFSTRASKEFAWNLFARNLQEVEATDFAVYHFVDKSDWKVRVSKKRLFCETEMSMKQFDIF